MSIKKILFLSIFITSTQSIFCSDSNSQLLQEMQSLTQEMQNLTSQIKSSQNPDNILPIDSQYFHKKHKEITEKFQCFLSKHSELIQPREQQTFEKMHSL